MAFWRLLLCAALGLGAACKDKATDTVTDDTADTGVDPFDGDAVKLADERTDFEDLWYSEALDRVLVVVPFGDEVSLVNPDSLEVTTLSVPGAHLSAAVSVGTWVVTLDRTARTIRVLDATSGEIVDEATSTTDITLIRPAAGGAEIWAAEPIADQIEIWSLGSAGGLIRQVAFGVDRGPIGLAADDSRGLVFTGLQSGELVGIDTTTRAEGERWLANCNAPFGNPAIDPVEALVLIGCETSTRVTLFETDDDGDYTDEVNLGANPTHFAWSQTLRRLYVRGDPGTALTVLDVDVDGQTTELGSLEVPSRGTALAADDRGQIWVTATEEGRLIRLSDPF